MKKFEENYTVLVHTMEFTRESFNGKSIKEIVHLLGGGSFSVNDWGSCQYSGALDMFNALEALKGQFGRDEALKIMGVSVKHYNINKDPDFSQFLIDKLENLEDEREGYEECKKRVDSQTAEAHDQNEVDYYEKLVQECADLKDKSITAYDAFHIAKNSGWDLWSAAPFIAKRMFKGLIINGITVAAPGQGPALNVLMQSHNYEIGLYCWLLWDANLFPGKSHEDVFGDFDT